MLASKTHLFLILHCLHIYENEDHTTLVEATLTLSYLISSSLCKYTNILASLYYHQLHDTKKNLQIMAFHFMPEKE